MSESRLWSWAHVLERSFVRVAEVVMDAIEKIVAWIFVMMFCIELLTCSFGYFLFEKLHFFLQAVGFPLFFSTGISHHLMIRGQFRFFPQTYMLNSASDGFADLFQLDLRVLSFCQFTLLSFLQFRFAQDFIFFAEVVPVFLVIFYGWFSFISLFFKHGFMFLDVILEVRGRVVIFIRTIVTVQNFIDFLLNVQRQILHQLTCTPTIQYWQLSLLSGQLKIYRILLYGTPTFQIWPWWFVWHHSWAFYQPREVWVGCDGYGCFLEEDVCRGFCGT